MTFCFPNKPIRIFTVDAVMGAIDQQTWVVQPKWNGHRALPSCDIDGKVKVFNRQGSALALAKSNFAWLSMLDLPRPWALDAELLRDGRMIVWDFSTLGGNLRIREPYENRLKELQALLPRKISKDRFSIEMIETLPVTKYRNYMLRRGEPELEGFVLKNSQASDLWGPYSTSENASQFKLRF